MYSSDSYIPSVEIRIPLSANEKYFRMLHYFLESLQFFGGPIGKRAKCIVSISRDEPYRDLYIEYPWISNYNAELRWIDQELFDAYGYDGTGPHRFNIESDADVVILADADLLVANNFDPIILKAHQNKKMYGFIAHVSPFERKDLGQDSSLKWWERIFHKANLPLSHFKHIHTGWGFMSRDRRHRHCPYYYNYGFIISPRKYIDRMGKTFLTDLKVVDSVVETWFKSQIANALSFERNQIPCDVMSVNYNFPLHVSDKKMRDFNPDLNGEDSPEDIKIFHYLGDGEFNREDFTSLQNLEKALMRKNLSDSGKEFQKKLQIIHDRLKSYYSE